MESRTFTCDHCREGMGEYRGLNMYPPYAVVRELKLASGGGDVHFCSAPCFASWLQDNGDALAVALRDERMSVAARAAQPVIESRLKSVAKLTLGTWPASQEARPGNGVFPTYVEFRCGDSRDGVVESVVSQIEWAFKFFGSKTVYLLTPLSWDRSKGFTICCSFGGSDELKG